MSYINVYPSRINWENEPSIASPINATNLNKIDYAVYEHDRTFSTWDITKANQSDLLLSLKDVSYDTDTGVFVFTWWNGTTQTVDLNIEKIPVSFSMSPQGVITMTTDDGTQYTADVGSLIKTYTFTDSSVIDFTVTTDADGNKTVTADIVDGSINGQKLQPNYLADCQSAKNDAENAADDAEDSSEDAEAWAVGERGGVPVPSTDPAYENSAKYWAQHTSSSLAGLTDTDITNPQDGDVLTYDSADSRWKNGTPSAGGGSKVVVSTAESSLYGATVTLSDGVTTLSATFDNAGVATFQGVTITGNLTVSASAGGQTATTTVNVPYFGNYTATLAFFSATITVTYPANGTCTITDGVTTLTASSNPMAFNIPNTGTWRATAVVDGVSKNGTAINITTDGQTASDTIQFGTINVTYADDFKGVSITCTSGGTTITKTAPAAGSTMVFYPPATGTWAISATYNGTVFSVNASVSSLSTPVSATLSYTKTINVTVYSAANDTVSYTDIHGATKTIVTNSSGTKSASIEIMPAGSTITFTSGVAKNPSNLSQAYSKSIALTATTTTVVVMPKALSNMLYWYGYKGSDLKDQTTANGWTDIGSTYNPTYSTNYVQLFAEAWSSCSGIYKNTAINSKTIKAIVEPINNASNVNVSVMLIQYTSKSISSSDKFIQVAAGTGVQLVQDTVPSANHIVACTSYNGAKSKVYAFWYE